MQPFRDQSLSYLLILLSSVSFGVTQRGSFGNAPPNPYMSVGFSSQKSTTSAAIASSNVGNSKTSGAVATTTANAAGIKSSSAIASATGGASTLSGAVATASGVGNTGSTGSTSSSTSSGTGSGPWCITIDGPSGMTCEANGGGFTGCTVGTQMCTQGGGAGGKIQLIAPGGSVGTVGTQIEPYFPPASGGAAQWNIDISYVNGYNYDVSCTGNGVNIGSTSGSLWQSSSANNHGCTGTGTAFVSADGVCSNVNGGALNTPSQAPAFFQSMGSALTGTYLAANQPDPGAFITSSSASITCKARGGYPGSSSSKRDATSPSNPEEWNNKHGYKMLRHVISGVTIGSTRNHARSLGGFIKSSKA